MEPCPKKLLDQVSDVIRLRLFDVHREPGVHARTRHQGTPGHQSNRKSPIEAAKNKRLAEPASLSACASLSIHYTGSRLITHSSSCARKSQGLAAVSGEGGPTGMSMGGKSPSDTW